MRCTRRMQRLVTAGLLPERAGQPVKVWAHISLADLMVLDGSSALQEEWTSRVRAAVGRAPGRSLGGRQRRRRVAGRRRRRGDGLRRGDGPVRDRRGEPGRPGGPRPAVRPARPAPPPPPDGTSAVDDDQRSDDTGAGGGTSAPAPDTTRAWEALEQAIIGKAVDLVSGPGGLASFLRRRQLGARLGGTRACRWTSGTARRSRPGSATRSSCGISIASGPGGATSPPRRARCITSSTRPTAARPAFETVFYFAGFTIRS